MSLQDNKQLGATNIQQNLIDNANTLLKALKKYNLPGTSGPIIPITNVPYPRFKQSQNIVFPVLIELDDIDGEVSSVMIDALGV